MRYILKKESAEMIKSKFKNSFLSNELNLTGTYISQILHRKKPLAKHVAYAFTKIVGLELDIEDLFEEVK